MDLTQETRPIFLICGCRKYQEYLTAAARRFRSEADWRIIQVIGGGDDNLTVFDGEILTLPVNDNYESLPKKIYAAYSWIYTNFPQTPGIWKTDDDIVYNNLQDLRTHIHNNKERPYWGLRTDLVLGGPIYDWRISDFFEDKTLTPTFQTTFYCFGHGYWITRRSLEIIVAEKAEYDKSFLEDVCTGYIMNKHDIQPKRIPIDYIEAQRTQGLLELI